MSTEGTTRFRSSSSPRRRPRRHASMSQIQAGQKHVSSPSPRRRRQRGRLLWRRLLVNAILFAILAFVGTVFMSVFSSTTSRKGKKISLDQAASIANRGNQTRRAHHPVIIIPGIVSTGLEVWQAHPSCAGHLFRTRIWGGATMIQQALMDPQCLQKHLMLNYSTGLDPDNIKVRPLSSFDSSDYLFGGVFWVWAPIIEELALIGYDPNNLFIATYDWRLSSTVMEQRDAYFTKLKSTIEIAHKTSGQKVAIVSHSYGSLVYLHFMNWVVSSKGGNANAHWVETHVHAFVNIAGPLLGVPKSVATLISAEMKDTAELAPPLHYLKERLWSRSTLIKLFRSWGSISDMLPMGGNRIWGSASGAPDDGSLSGMVAFTSNRAESKPSNCSQVGAEDRLGPEEALMSQEAREAYLRKQFLSVDDSVSMLRELAPVFMQRFDRHKSVGYATNLDSAEYNKPKYWSNPLESRLPRAPSVKVFCLYGVGKETERAYRYREHPGDGGCSRVPFQIDTETAGHGILSTDGDGTVPLISLGFMCVRGWRSRRYNPASMSVTTREYKHKPMTVFVSGGDLRGGPASGDHVDILGNHDVIDDLIQIVSAAPDPEQRILSDIEDIAARVEMD
ncbi:unnamed protein product (mitochondrion) [Plasmodiophora brassicae]|uniref:Phospholipid:diacylglycerol acyltransferase n=1 Tax=Plasmodiophora brassicae TaxID=37360 RepID=A0A0G4IK94_PLABS|nr:hypothetical protein PBRA_004382 [Plasmodiophora brassicae]SPR00526.1 unnamed protein product [Plasmodiophora brassicae]